MNIPNPFRTFKEKFFKAEVEALKKELGKWKRATRPAAGDLYKPESVVPYYPFPPDTVYTVAKYSDVLTGMHRALRTEIFRNGIEVIESQDQDTENTDREEETPFQHKSRKEILAKLERINLNGQSIIELLEQLEDDINIIDHAYMWIRYDYFVDSTGEITDKEFVEAIRLHPATMMAIKNNADEFGKDDQGNTLKAAPSDRSQVFTNRDYHPVTGEKLYPVWWKQTSEKGEYYFFEWEIVHATRYRPEGFSPIITAWQKVRTLQYQDKYFLELYEGKRPPKGLLAFYVANRESMKKAWDDMIERAKENPHLPGIIGIPPAATGGNGQTKVMEFVDFMKSMDELQFSDQRQEFKLALGFLYGVSPILMNDVSTSGGLNNEGLQYTVTNRAVEAAQNLYNRKFLAAIRDALKAQGWIIRLRPSEEQDEMAKLQRIQQALQNGKAAAELGLKARYDRRTGEVIIEDGEIQNPSQDMGGLFSAALANRQEPGIEPSRPRFTGEPEPSRNISGMPEQAKSEKGWVYLKPGSKPPEGAKTRQGPGGATYYWSEPKINRRTLLEKDPEDMTPEELEAAYEMMEADQTSYTQEDLEAAKRWLANKPHLRRLFGKNYYDFAVEVASAIHRGEDPDLIDWESIDRKIGIRDALMEQRQPEPFEMSAKKKVEKKGREGYTRLADLLTKEIQERMKGLKKKPTPAQLKKIAKEIQDKLTPELKKTADKLIEAHYKKAMREAEKELGKKLGFGDKDLEAIKTLQTQKVLTEAFAGLSKELAKGIHEIIKDAYKTGQGLTTRKLQKRIQELTDLAEHRAENIARTETGKVSAAARINQYRKADPENKFLYKWVGPDDHRTTRTCKRIMQRTKNGVPFDELVRIIEEESKKDFPDFTIDKDAPVAHYQCRHTFVKVGQK
ncbi:phage portal protein [Candidatus Woesearchaeota archaeon]|nr:MAG: phage portal protein [Candidatus Woesearchaeota archaeon]